MLKDLNYNLCFPSIYVTCIIFALLRIITVQKDHPSPKIGLGHISSISGLMIYQLIFIKMHRRKLPDFRMHSILRVQKVGLKLIVKDPLK